MTDQHKGTLFIFSAPSGAGKSSLAKALVESMPELGVSISHTTRAPRPGEADGLHYYFVTVDQFEAMIVAGEFLEYARVFDHYYGTTRAEIERLLDVGKHVILDIDWQGARAIKAQIASAQGVFILPPSRAALESRLKGRGQDSDEIISRRMRDAAAEMSHYPEFDHVIVNDDFDLALADLRAIITGQYEKVRPLGINPAALLAETDTD